MPGRFFVPEGTCAQYSLRTIQAHYMEELTQTLDSALTNLSQLNTRVVAAFQGAAAGAGIVVILGCDLVLADLPTRFALTHSGAGMTPGQGSKGLPLRTIGERRALAIAREVSNP